MEGVVECDDRGRMWWTFQVGLTAAESTINCRACILAKLTASGRCRIVQAAAIVIWHAVGTIHSHAVSHSDHWRCHRGSGHRPVHAVCRKPIAAHICRAAIQSTSCGLYGAPRQRRANVPPPTISRECSDI